MPTTWVYYAISNVFYSMVFYMEVTILKMLSHPKLYRYKHCICVKKNQLWMALEFMDAGSLAMQVFDRPYVSPLSVIGFCGWFTHA